jgi:putative hemin transport protein
MESHGTFGGFSRTGPFFNVQTASLDLHLRWAAIAGLVAVEKPSHQTGHPTASIQLFDAAGAPILKVFVLFGEHATASVDRRTAFHDLRSEYALSTEGKARSVDPMP